MVYFGPRNAHSCKSTTPQAGLVSERSFSSTKQCRMKERPFCALVGCQPPVGGCQPPASTGKFLFIEYRLLLGVVLCRVRLCGRNPDPPNLNGTDLHLTRAALTSLWTSNAGDVLLASPEVLLAAVAQPLRQPTHRSCTSMALSLLDVPTGMFWQMFLWPRMGEGMYASGAARGEPLHGS